MFGAELVNDVEVAKAIESDDATSVTTDTASVEPPGDDDYVLLVPQMPLEEDCDFMSSLPDPDDVSGDFGNLCQETTLDSKEEEEREEDFFDSLRHWVWDGCATQSATQNG